MIQLSSLKLAGFKSIRDTGPDGIQFGRLTVLVGANGSGKSNLLSFFGLLNFLTNESLQKFIGVNGGPNSLLFNGLKVTKELSAVLQFTTERGVNTYEMTLVPASKRWRRTLIFTRETASFAAPGRKPLTPFELGAGHEESALLDPRYAKTDPVPFFLHALRGFRFYQFHDTSPESALREYRAEVRNFRPFHSNGGNLPAVLYRLKEFHAETWHLLIRTIRLVAPFFRDFQFEFDEGSSPAGAVVISWTAEGKDYQFGMHQISDGTLRFIALATLLLLPEGMRPAGAVLIDEPELGLHPRALVALAGLIRTASESVQIICTTQSPDFLSEFEPEDVRVVEVEEGATVFKKLDGERLRVWLEDEFTLGEIWKKNLIGGRPKA